MRDSKTNLVRLLASVAAATSSSLFVVLYTRSSRFRFEYEHPDGHLMKGSVALVEQSGLAFLFPVLVLIAGLWIQSARPNLSATFEAVVSLGWLFALLLPLLTVLMWQTQNCPTFSHMTTHY